MSKQDIYKIKNQTPVSVIMHGGDYLGFLLAQTLIEQGSQVVIIDKFTAQTKKYTNELKKKGQITFINIKSCKTLFEGIGRIDYLYYNTFNVVENEEDFSSSFFLTESDNLNIALKASQKFKSKMSLITSLRLNRELANRVNNDNLSQPSAYSNIELQRYCENLSAEFRDQTNANLRIIRLATVMGNVIEKLPDPKLHKLFSEASTKNQIEIVGEGLDIHNIIHQNDAIYGILKLTFNDKTKGEVISLTNKNDYTTLSMAYKLLELNVEAQSIKFVEEKSLPIILQDLYVPAPNASKYGWKQQITLEEIFVEQLRTYYEQSDNKWDLPKETEIEKKSNTLEVRTEKAIFLSKIFSIFKKSDKKFFEEIDYLKFVKVGLIIILTLLFIYFFLSPIIGISISGLVLGKKVEKLKEDISNFNFDSANNTVNEITYHTNKIDKNISRLNWIFTLTNKSTLYTEIDKILLGADYATQSATSLITGFQPLALYIRDFEPAVDLQSGTVSNMREYRDYLKGIEDNSYLISDGSYKLGLANDIISSINVDRFPQFLQDAVLDIKDLSRDSYLAVDNVKSVVTFLPDILGQEGRKRYLILLQNEGEIRSTGGWISSYAIVGIEGGQIRELFVDDIYNAEGTLKVQGKKYVPPTSMIKALELTNYSFSLVNWSPDLNTVMLNSETFINDLGKGSSLDGIITIDTMFVQKLLDVWGGIEVPGESELVTSSNLYSKIFDMHNSFTPGSTRKTTFLANLANQTIIKILSSNFAQYQNIASVLGNSLDEKHIQINLKNPSARAFLDNKYWSGNLDYEYITAPITIDWNWGANKANLYLKRDHNLNVDIEDSNNITYTYEINTLNESTTNQYPQGDYTNYQRIYLPIGAQILEIEGIEDNEYFIYTEDGFQVVGGFFNTPTQGNNTFRIRYKISRDNLGSIFPLVSQNDSIFLDFNIFKQAGVKQESYVVNISYPQDWDVIKYEGMSNLSNQLSRRLDLVSNTSFDISWIR